MDKESKQPDPKKWVNDSRHNDYGSAKSRCDSLKIKHPGCEVKIRKRPTGHFDVKFWNLGASSQKPKTKKAKKKK